MRNGGVAWQAVPVQALLISEQSRPEQVLNPNKINIVKLGTKLAK